MRKKPDPTNIMQNNPLYAEQRERYRERFLGLKKTQSPRVHLATGEKTVKKKEGLGVPSNVSKVKKEAIDSESISPEALRNSIAPVIQEKAPTDRSDKVTEEKNEPAIKMDSFEIVGDTARVATQRESIEAFNFEYEYPENTNMLVTAAVYVEESKRFISTLQKEFISAIKAKDRWLALRNVAVKNSPKSNTGILALTTVVVSVLAVVFTLVSIIALLCNCALTILGTVAWVVLAAVTAICAAIACALSVCAATLTAGLAAVVSFHLGLKGCRWISTSVVRKLEVPGNNPNSDSAARRLLQTVQS